MFKTRRKRAIVLALIAFFCATSYVAVDWKRFGGGFLALLKGKRDPVLASTGGGAGSDGTHVADGATSHSHDASLPQLAAATSRRHATGNGAGGAKADEDDLFKYGNPAAGGIPPGSFIVAQNDTPATGGRGDVGAPPAPETGDGGGDGGVTSAAPAPAGGGNGSSSGLPGSGTKTTTPPATAPAPSGPSDPGGGLGASPPAPVSPVSAIPEASSLAMMSLGALFVVVAATRRRKIG